jgi:ATP-dependent protease HslVU (ClpYQ) peptidase subunit
MACDLQFTEGTSKWKGKTKVYRFKANALTYPHCDFIMGFAGTASDIIAVAEFFSMPETTKPPKTKGLKGLVLTEQGDIFAWDDWDRWIAVDQPYAAIGSGQPVALGAMAAGLTPKEAVKAAMKHDAYTGFGVKVFHF